MERKSGRLLNNGGLDHGFSNYALVAARRWTYSKGNDRFLMSRLASKAALGFVLLFGAMGAVLFVGAGTLKYWQAWLFFAFFLGPAGWITLYLWTHDRIFADDVREVYPWGKNRTMEMQIPIV